MSLEAYFSALITRLEESDIQNDGKDAKGFFKPTRAVLLQNLNLLRDLHAKPHAKAMVKKAWANVAEELPSEWLILNEDDKAELKKILN